jgi:hypothetical protein
MRRTLLAAVMVLTSGVPLAAAETWSAAYQRGDYGTAATLLQRIVFERPQERAADPAALRQLGLLYASGKGVERNGVLACGLLRASALATSSAPRAAAAAKRAAQALVEQHCAGLPAADRAAALGARSCPRIGLPRGSTITLEPGWSVQFNDRSATIERNGQAREHPIAGDLCRAQVRLMRHSPLEASNGRSPGTRHVIELVTLRSGSSGGAVTRELVWQLYEVRGLDLDLAAVQRWQEPGSAWPAPALPDALARGATFTVRGPDIQYEIPDAPLRRGTVEVRTAKR